MRGWQSLGWIFVGVFLTLAVLSPSPALAYQQPSYNCNTRVNEEGQETSPTTFKGNRATVQVSPWTGDCIRVSSIAVLMNTNPNDQVEIGWSLGYYINNMGILQYTVAPLLFEQWTPPGQVPREYNIQTFGSQVTSIIVTVQDGNLNSVWTPYLGNPPQQVGVTMAVDFSRGNPITNGERHSTCRPADSTPSVPCDSAYSHFFALKRWKVTDSGFTAWQSQGHGPVNVDPWYWWDYTSATESYVRLCSAISCAGD